MPGAGTIAIISYSIYLTHKLVTRSTELLLGTQAMASFGGFALYFATSIAAGALL